MITVPNFDCPAQLLDASRPFLRRSGSRLKP